MYKFISKAIGIIIALRFIVKEIPELDVSDIFRFAFFEKSQGELVY